MPLRASFPISSTKSCRRVQQMQPLDSSTTSSSRWISSAPFTMSASMLISAMSLTSTAHFRPSLFLRMCVSIVVLPAPRKPDRSVTGSLGSALSGLFLAPPAPPLLAWGVVSLAFFPPPKCGAAAWRAAFFGSRAAWVTCLLVAGMLPGSRSRLTRCAAVRCPPKAQPESQGSALEPLSSPRISGFLLELFLLHGCVPVDSQGGRQGGGEEGRAT
mmetsp:Transcript_15420/g.37570  ORF Transcript_15420/g.37570 Transcript_15420/m.37570 type:complete len:215 (-) Transcript_15420:32-676(-)